MSTVFIIDIDTTIANNDHRAIFLEKECLGCSTKLGVEYRPVCPVCGGTAHVIAQAGWDKFLKPELLLQDSPEPKAQQAIANMRQHGIPFHFITGRNERLREPTETWLSEHFDWNSSRERLKMRTEAHKNTRASVYKEQAFKELVEELSLQDNSFIFMEDDTHVFRMYEKYGIVIRCPEGWEHWCPTPETGIEPVFKR